MIASTDTSDENDYLVKVTGTQHVYLTYNYNEQKVGIQIGEDIIDISLLLADGSTLTLTYIE